MRSSTCRSTRSVARGCSSRRSSVAVLDGRADLAVHSAKDLRSTPEPGLLLAAFCERRTAADALVGSRLIDLAAGATVATGSVRRRRQIGRARPDLQFEELRGNIQTRLTKIPVDGAIVMAVAALEILDLTDRIAEDPRSGRVRPGRRPGMRRGRMPRRRWRGRRRARRHRPRHDPPRGRDRAGIPGRARIGVLAAGRRVRRRAQAAHVPRRRGFGHHRVRDDRADR